MIPAADRQILRDLAQRVAEIAALPAMAERKRLWRQHNSLKPCRPMILIFPEGSWRELLPDSALRCTDKAARGIEWDLRHRIYTYEHFASDNVIEKEWTVQKAIRHSGWGLEAQWTHSSSATGARAFKPVILERGNLKKLHFPVVEHDEQATREHLSGAQELFAGILDVKLKGVAHISFHLMSLYTSLRGLEQVMLDMVEEPEWLHEAMAFLEEGHRRLVRQYVEQNLFSLNNDNTYHSSGGNGFTGDLPAPGFDPERVRPSDMWASAEAQELAQVSPGMHREFSLEYEKRLLAPFGLNGYGCCEDLTAKLNDVLTIPRIRRVSCSPWAHVDRCAEKLGAKCIFSWKPHPSHLVGEFSTGRIEEYIRHAVEACRRHGCVLEMILKDTHTCEQHPERFDEWTRVARRVVEAG